jgi:hypothetical protein
MLFLNPVSLASVMKKACLQPSDLLGEFEFPYPPGRLLSAELWMIIAGIEEDG